MLIYRLRHAMLFRYLILTLVINIVNISVDAPDLLTELYPEDLRLNDQESIVELILEEMMGYEDAIPESDDNEKGAEGKKNNARADILALDLTLSNIYLIQESHGLFTGRHRSEMKPSDFTQILSPPPEI